MAAPGTPGTLTKVEKVKYGFLNFFSEQLSAEVSWRGHFKFRNNYLDFWKRKSCMSTLNSKSKNGLKLFDCYLVNYLDSSGGKSLWRILTLLPLPPGNPDTNQLYFEIYIHKKVDWISMSVALLVYPINHGMASQMLIEYFSGKFLSYPRKRI